VRLADVIRCIKRFPHSRGEHRHFMPASSKRSWNRNTTMDITPIFNQVLVRHNAHPVESYVFRVEDLDEFVKEAYRIVGHVARCKFGTHFD
jgi:hypothetical protein